MTSPRSDLAASSLTNSAPARGQVTLPSFLSRRWVREAGDGPLARFVTRRNRWRWSPLRAALRELGRSLA